MEKLYQELIEAIRVKSGLENNFLMVIKQVLDENPNSNLLKPVVGAFNEWSEKQMKDIVKDILLKNQVENKEGEVIVESKVSDAAKMPTPKDIKEEIKGAFYRRTLRMIQEVGVGGDLAIESEIRENVRAIFNEIN